LKLERLTERWQAFGWNVIETDGNCVEKLLDVFLNGVPGNRKPTMIIAGTGTGSCSCNGGCSVQANPDENNRLPR